MLLYTCQACVAGKHDLCAGRQAPPPGMLGGSECDCDGKCGERPRTPDPQIEAAVEAVVARCPRCAGDGYEVEPECCGNTTSSGECRGDCAVPVQVPCSACGGSGRVPDEQMGMGV